MSIQNIPTEYVTTAHKLADTARPIIKKYFRTRLEIISKSDDSPVTIADRTAEMAMREIIMTNFSDHGIRGEEYGIHNETADWCWVFDPIDGTKSFMSGSLCFGTQIGLTYKGQPMLGLIDQPITGERWFGMQGTNSQFGEQTIFTSKTCELENAILYTSAPEHLSEDQKPCFKRLSDAAHISRYSHDCYGAGLLAMGMVDLLVETNLYDYDIVPQIPIIEGAGGVVTDWQGNKLEKASYFKSVLYAANATLHAKALALLQN